MSLTAVVDAVVFNPPATQLTLGFDPSTRKLRAIINANGDPLSGDTSAETEFLVHPTIESIGDADRRWVLWLERASQVHGDVRVVPRLPAPTGMR